MSKKIHIVSKKFETTAQAEWRYFVDANLNGAYNPYDVIRSMTDKGNIESATNLMKNKKQTIADKDRIAYLNSHEYDTKIMKMIEKMVVDNGFLQTE